MLYVAFIGLLLLEGYVRYKAIQAEAERVAIVNAKIRSRIDDI